MVTGHEYHGLPVLEVIDETPDTRSFVLGIPAGLETEFAYTAGQFCTFRVTVNGAPIVRCYSMSSSPDTDDRFVTTVKRVPGGMMSNWLNDEVQPGDVLEVMRPAGLFVLHPHETPIVAFAGGSGITPVISVIKSALATTTRPIVLVYANRDPESTIFRADVERLAAESGGRLSVHLHFDSEAGFLDPDACAALAGDRGDADFYICGPGPYMDTVEAGVARLGVGAGQIFIERFVTPVEGPGITESSVTESLVIRLGRRKKTIDYHAGETILQAARRAGLSPPFSCEAGNCATCMAHLDEGRATMRANNALSADELDDGWILTCQAVPESETVVVDYDA